MIASFRSTARVTFVGVAALCAAIGCAENPAPPKKVSSNTPVAPAAEKPKQEPELAKTTPAEDAEEVKTIKENRAKLSPEDQKLVDAQEWCVISNEERLGGTMGAPIKLMIKGEPVFICCKSCKKDAEANPEKTLAKVAELKEKKKKEVSDKK